MTIGIEATHANREKRTGVEEYCFEIIQHLKKIIPADVRVILYTNKPLIEGLRVLPPNWSERVLRWPFAKGWSQFRLSAMFLSRRPDIFFAPGQLVPFIAPKNTVATVHDSAFMVFPGAYSFLGRQYLKWMNWLVLKKTKLAITPSEFSRQELERLYRYDIGRVRVIPLGFDKNLYKKIEISQEERKRIFFKFGITKPFYVSVGRLEEKKNTATLIRAFDLIKKQADVQLVLVGVPGHGFDKVKKALEESPNKDDIICPGWVMSKELAELYNLAVALLFPSKYEGFGLPLLDAMACGCPAVASTGNSLEDVGGDGPVYVSAWSVKEIADAAVGLFVDRGMRNYHISKGLARVAEFSWENSAKLTWSVLSEALK